MVNMLLLGEIAADVSRYPKLRLKVNGEMRGAPSRDHRNAAARHHLPARLHPPCYTSGTPSLR